MRRCDEFVDAMAAEAAGEIEPETRDGLLAHLESCPACAAVSARLGDALDGLRSEAIPDPGPAYWASFGGRVRRRILDADRRLPARRVQLLAAAVLVAAAGIGLFATLRRAGHVTPGIDTGPAARGAVAASPGSGGVGITGLDGDAAAEARFEAVLQEFRGAGAVTSGGDLEALLEEIAPGDPFALAGGWDDGRGDDGGDPGV